MTNAAQQAPAAFDLGSIEDVPQAEFELLHPATGKGLNAFITLAGPEHPDRKKLTFNMIREARAEAALRAANGGASAASVEDPEQSMAESLDLLASITLDWRNMQLNGQPLACNKGNALALYSDSRRQWIVRQMMAKMRSADAFIKA